MIRYRHNVAGDTITVHIPQDSVDLAEFLLWAQEANKRGPIALDTETTGLDIFSSGYRLRTVQFGDKYDAWVIHWERGHAFVNAAREVLHNAARFLIHNAPFDWLVIDWHGGVTLEELAAKTTDTKIKATLVDPRQPQEGGIGTGLKPNSAYHVDRTAIDTQSDLTAVFRSLGLTKATGWAGIPLDHPTYNLYAGLDCIYTARLDEKLTAELARLGVRDVLVQYEHEIARMCTIMQRKGMILDVDYVHALSKTLRTEEAKYVSVAARYGVTSVNSGKQVGEALLGMGETMILPGNTKPEYTSSGALKVDKAVLLSLADLNADWERVGGRTPNKLADAVLHAKRAGKWCTTYADTFLETVGTDGRIHCFVNTLAARTGRMSITRPALQTLPSRDQMIRRAMLADEGHVIVSTDFSAVEFRVLAALADVKAMKEAIAAGRDLHEFTAELVYGPNFTAKHRKLCKGVGFGKVYGGGANGIARMTGAPIEAVQRTMTAYDRIYPEVNRASGRWQREARANGMVFVSATGRRLPLDRDRMYAVVNYACQSAARDVLGQSMMNMDKAGLLDYMRLPIHDEIVASVPKGEAADFAHEFERCMSFDLRGVPIAAEAEVGGRSWGSLYGADF